LSRCGREETPANVEDEALIALSIEDLITSLGCVLEGTASNVDDAS